MTYAAASLHNWAHRVQDNAVFIALGLYSAIIGTGWIAFAASFN